MFESLFNANDFVNGIMSWPSISSSMQVGIIVGIIALVINLLLLWKAAYWGHSLQDEALKLLIMRFSERAFSDAPSLPLARELAHEIQKKTGCPVIADSMIQEAIRMIRERQRRQQASKNLKPIFSNQQKAVTATGITLDSVVMEFDAQRRTLNSVAYTNRMYAYTFCVLGLVVGLFLIQFSKTYSNSLSDQIIFWALLALQGLVAIMTGRAYLYWKKQCTRISDMGEFASPAHPPSKYFDIFVYWLANSPIAGILLAPVWEGNFWIVIPSIQGKVLVGWVIAQLTSHFGMSDAQIKSVLTSCYIPLWVILSFGGTLVIINLHSYKWFETRQLARRLSTLQRKLKIAQFEKKSTPPIMRDYLDLARKLWTINGTLYHWELETLARESIQRGDLSKSEALYREALEILLAGSVNYYKDVTRVVTSYVDLLVMTNRLTEAMKLEHYARELGSATPTIRSEILHDIQKMM